MAWTVKCAAIAVAVAAPAAALAAHIEAQDWTMWEKYSSCEGLRIRFASPKDN